MASAKKQAISGVFSLITIGIIAIIGFFFVRFLLKFRQDQANEQQDRSDFKKKGFFGSLKDFFLGQSSDSGSGSGSGGSSDGSQNLFDQISNAFKSTPKPHDDSPQIIRRSDGLESTAPKQGEPRVLAVDQNFSDFEFSKPITSPTRQTLNAFRFFRTAPSSREESQARKDAAIKAARDAGFNVPKGVTPINTLTSDASRIQRFSRQLESSQKRRLGLRKV